MRAHATSVGFGPQLVERRVPLSQLPLSACFGAPWLIEAATLGDSTAPTTDTLADRTAPPAERTADDDGEVGATHPSSLSLAR